MHTKPLHPCPQAFHRPTLGLIQKALLQGRYVHIQNALRYESAPALCSDIMDLEGRRGGYVISLTGRPVVGFPLPVHTRARAPTAAANFTHSASDPTVDLKPDYFVGAGEPEWCDEFNARVARQLSTEM